ncbi:RNA polymerase sigma factor SigJ [Kribbella sp. NPDC059898]|uniref:RNA polymerase sigma factor SigJ n=1 Tax=Kribbella sp. NPDC059898 TaxID=3346995 RepID=UPI0036478FE8
MSERTDMAEPGLDVIMSERRQLINLAYRLLGSLADAEDVVQETYARWYAMTLDERHVIENPAAWLTRVASRICLDQLRSARARRERYVGEWIPEPLPDDVDGPADPADRITLDESVNMAFLVVLDAMTPAERVSFILHDVFRYPFPEVAEIVGRTPAACRQLASSARRRIRESQSPTPPSARRAELVRAFKAAWEATDIQAIVKLLDPDATAVADGGGLVTAFLDPIHGGPQVAQRFTQLPVFRHGRTILERMVNGQPGLVIEFEGKVETVLAFDFAGDLITNIWTVRNPEKLRPWMH